MELVFLLFLFFSAFSMNYNRAASENNVSRRNKSDAKISFTDQPAQAWNNNEARVQSQSDSDNRLLETNNQKKPLQSKQSDGSQQKFSRHVFNKRAHSADEMNVQRRKETAQKKTSPETVGDYHNLQKKEESVVSKYNKIPRSLPTVVGGDEFYDCTLEEYFSPLRQDFKREYVNSISRYIMQIILEYAVHFGDIHYATGKHPLSFVFFFVDKKRLKLLEIYKEKMEKHFGYQELFGLTTEKIMQRNSWWRKIAANALAKFNSSKQLKVVDGQIVFTNEKVSFGDSIAVVWKSRANKHGKKMENQNSSFNEIERITWNTDMNAFIVKDHLGLEDCQWHFTKVSTEQDKIYVTTDFDEIESWRIFWRESVPIRWNYALVYPCDF